MQTLTMTIDGNNIGDICNADDLEWLTELIDNDRLKTYRHEIDLYYTVDRDGVVYFQANTPITQDEMAAAARQLVILALVNGLITPHEVMNERNKVLSHIRHWVYSYGDGYEARQKVYENWKDEVE